LAVLLFFLSPFSFFMHYKTINKNRLNIRISKKRAKKRGLHLLQNRAPSAQRP